MRFKFNKEYDKFKYFGRGAEENYIDRNIGQDQMFMKKCKR